jgi:hypothetical protein
VNESDPHIHVDVKLHADVAARGILAATFGLAGDLPARATTGCGVDVPYVMTSTDPGAVTCLACREYAHRRYLELATEVEGLGRAPGVDAGLGQQAATATAAYRALAHRFSTEGPG